MIIGDRVCGVALLKEVVACEVVVKDAVRAVIVNKSKSIVTSNSGADDMLSKAKAEADAGMVPEVDSPEWWG